MENRRLGLFRTTSAPGRFLLRSGRRRNETAGPASSNSRGDGVPAMTHGDQEAKKSDNGERQRVLAAILRVFPMILPSQVVKEPHWKWDDAPSADEMLEAKQGLLRSVDINSIESATARPTPSPQSSQISDQKSNSLKSASVQSPRPAAPSGSFVKGTPPAQQAAQSTGNWWLAVNEKEAGVTRVEDASKSRPGHLLQRTDDTAQVPTPPIAPESDQRRTDPGTHALTVAPDTIRAWAPVGVAAGLLMISVFLWRGEIGLSRPFQRRDYGNSLRASAQAEAALAQAEAKARLRFVQLHGL